MILRESLDRIVPLAKGESALSPEVRRYAFRGLYSLKGRVISAETIRNYNLRTKDNFPYRHTVTRELWGVRDVSGDNYEIPEFDTADEINDPETLARINRIEGIAKKMKFTTSAVLAGLGITFGLVRATTDVPVSTTVESCATVAGGSEVFVPATDTAKSLGITVCKIGSFDYVPVPSTAG